MDDIIAGALLEMEENDCVTCSEIRGTMAELRDMCPESDRPCGHHCNHLWQSDCCCWCGVQIDEDGNLPVIV
jgi:hypothetical protein